MTDFYTNVAYYKGKILVRGYLNGERYQNREEYKPYLFLPSNTPTEYKTLDDQFVQKKIFSSIREAKDFYKQYSTVENFSVYGLDKFIYTYIYDNYPGEIQYDTSLIKIWNIDIETDSKNGFPDIKTANKAITLIGIRINNIRTVFGWMDEYTSKRDTDVYIKCVNEYDMLRQFLNMWETNGPDIITGWNIEGFDIPYLVNRITLLLGEDAARRLSPWGVINSKTIESRGMEIETYNFLGISTLDYYALYRKFTYNKQESYTLDHIAFVETGKRKLDYSEYESLNDLCEKNYEKFVDYNITDLDRVNDIDENNKFIELALAIAYDAKVNYIDALTSVLLWDVICHNYLMDRNIVIPKFELKQFVDIPGGYVKEPQIGMHEHVVSVDVQSEYPHAIIQWNISPETLIDIEPWSDKKLQDFVSGKFEVMHDYIQAGNGARFLKPDIRTGFLSELMKKQFELRLQYKNKLKELKKSNADKNLIQQYDNLQKAKKIQLNSLYGSLANRYCRYYDWRLASAITLSGQMSVRFIELKLNAYLNSLLKTNNFDYIIAMDTDSCYINFNPLIKMVGLNDKSRTESYLDKICKEKIEPKIAEWFQELAIRVGATHSSMVMKREAIADKAIWRAAKMYIMNVVNNEDIHYDEPELKVMGIEAVRSSTPHVCREAIKKALKIILNKTEEDLIAYIEEFKKEFYGMEFEDVAFPRGMNNLHDYSDRNLIYKKGTPIHVRAALVYNHMITREKISAPLIVDKEKIKFCYMKLPNPSKSNVIAAARNLPKQLNLHPYIDYDLQFEKAFLEPIKSITGVIGWEVEKKSSLSSFFN